MSKQNPDTKLYSRGKYQLGWDRRADGSLASPYYQIFWYDATTRHKKRLSTGTSDEQEAELALDKHYLRHERGLAICPTCGKPNDINAGADNYTLSTAISDYLIDRQEVPSFDAIQHRISHVLDYLEDTNQTTIACAAVTGEWIDAFRKWLSKKPVRVGKHETRARSIATIEGSVRQLAAAINKAFNRRLVAAPASFSAKKASAISQSPLYRADIFTMARMMRYAMVIGEFEDEIGQGKMLGRHRMWRAALHRYLQVAIATWARPDAIYDLSVAPARHQWISSARVVNLNPRGREQTKKYRPSIPVGERFAKLLDGATGFYVGVSDVEKAFSKMSVDLGLPGDGESGPKLIRRSMSTVGRKMMGEDAWAQGERMLGHREAVTSDIYALPEASQLGKALAVTNQIIEEICVLAPGAFDKSYVACTRLAPDQIQEKKKKVA